MNSKFQNDPFVQMIAKAIDTQLIKTEENAEDIEDAINAGLIEYAYMKDGVQHFKLTNNAFKTFEWMLR